MKPETTTQRVAPSLSPRERALAVVSKTNHVGKRYADGAPNNCKPSTVAGMMAGLDVMLAAYKGEVK